MQYFRSVLFIGITEITIGGTTLVFNLLSLILGVNTKSPSVFLFVIVAGTISLLLGIGILKFKKLAYDLLLFFSAFVLLTKLLIFLGVFHLDGSLENMIPDNIKNLASIAYHGFVIYYLRKSTVKILFEKA